MNDPATSPEPGDRNASDAVSEGPWYAGVTRYQWLVLVIACAGWVFDVYEGQIFNITRAELLGELLDGDQEAIKRWGDYFLGIFLVGGTTGGLLFGSLADRFGRRPTMIITILLYSLFSGLTYFVNDIYTLGVLRFIVALGIGGEWAVAASLVAEVFSAKARAHASGIFHASSILGTWLAALAALAVGSQWRYAYLLGVLPAFLIVWVRISVRETDRWKKTQATKRQLAGSFRELLLRKPWNGLALRGILLAAVGLGTFWAVTVAGQDIARQQLLQQGRSAESANQSAKFAYGIIQASGGGLGLLSFGPISARLGRRRTFVLFHLVALAVVPATCFLPQTYFQLLCILPLFGFFTLGMHAGYAIYFPELFPTHIRATGTSFCFNGGRLLAVPVLLFSGWLKSQPGVALPWAVTGLSGLFVLGIVIVLTMPETRGRELIDDASG